jgi:hypothetical protein
MVDTRLRLLGMAILYFGTLVQADDNVSDLIFLIQPLQAAQYYQTLRKLAVLLLLLRSSSSVRQNLPRTAHLRGVLF